MIFPVSKLLQYQDDLVSVGENETVRDALNRMVAHDFSQLPVLDERGDLAGIISEQSITRSYFYGNDSVSLFDLPVHHCQTRAVTIRPDADVFDVLGRLKDVAAVVVVDGRKPTGVVTYYDVTLFFRGVSEGLMYVEDVEVTLRSYIETVFSEPEQLDDALIRAFGEDKREAGQPNRSYERMSFYDQLQLITHATNWEYFERFFEPVALFRQLMNEVRIIRNQLAHFRDDVSVVQLNALLHGRNWLASRPKPPRQDTLAATAANKSEAQARALAAPASLDFEGEYGPLYRWLQQLPTDTNQVEMSLLEIEKILDDDLPDSARTHQAWWANSTTNRARAWLQAGWRVSNANLQDEKIVFERSHAVLYQVFFDDVLTRLHSRRPDVASAITAGARNELVFAAGYSGFSYRWTFNRGRIFKIELYIDKGDGDTNKRIFDELKEKQARIEERFGEPLDWERLDDYRASRIALRTPGTIDSSKEQLEPLKQWAAEKMPRLVDVFQPHLRDVADE